MGLDIYAIKIKKLLDSNLKNDAAFENARIIFCLDHSPIVHLSQIKEGIYDVEELDSPDFAMGYAGYNCFRLRICEMAHGIRPNVIWNNIDKWLGKPFVELIYFADNEGCFDYVIAQKLYNDFSSYKAKAAVFLDDYEYKKYCDYMSILKIVADNKGVVRYC